MMKVNSVFTKVILLVILCVICIVATVGIALLAGAVDTTLFDFKKLNLANLIPVLLIGIFFSCVIVGIAVLFIGKSAFLQMRDYLNENNKNNGGNKE